MPSRKIIRPGTGKTGPVPHVPTEVERNTVKLMVAGGIAQADIARAKGMAKNTLYKYYAEELAVGKTEIDTIVIVEHMKRIRAGDFQAIKWWQQSRMGYSERIVVDDGKPADTPMRVVVEFVGDPAPPRADQVPQQAGPRLPADIRKTVQLVG